MSQKLEGLSDEIKETPTYKQMNKAEQLTKDAELVVKDPKSAMDMLKGKTPLPEGHTHTGIGLALEQEAKINPKLATDLTSLRATRYGQELSFSRKLMSILRLDLYGR